MSFPFLPFAVPTPASRSARVLGARGRSGIRHGRIKPHSLGEMADGDPRGSYASRPERGSLPVPLRVCVLGEVVARLESSGNDKLSSKSVRAPPNPLVSETPRVALPRHGRWVGASPFPRARGRGRTRRELPGAPQVRPRGRGHPRIEQESQRKGRRSRAPAPPTAPRRRHASAWSRTAPT